jgi:glucose-1-phosphate thymidylyltransferase
MQGVVPAAGRGTRLRPLTADRPKALVEVAGKPLLAHCFERLLEVGVDELVVVIGYRGGAIVDRFGDTFEGAALRYVEQPDPAGLADAVLAAEAAVDGDFVVLNGDNVVDAALAPVLDRHRATAAAATLLVEDVSPARASEGGVLVFDDGRLVGLVEKPDDPPSTWVTRGFHAFAPRIFEACRELEPAATGEYELTAVVDRLLQAGARVETVPLEGRCVNVNTPEDLARAERLLEG